MMQHSLHLQPCSRPLPPLFSQQGHLLTGRGMRSTLQSMRSAYLEPLDDAVLLVDLIIER